jgi:hypothetical protein
MIHHDHAGLGRQALGLAHEGVQVGGDPLELPCELRRHRVLQRSHGRLSSRTAWLSPSDPGQPISTSPATRSGWSSATRRAVKQLPECPTKLARSASTASKNATTSESKSATA